MYLFALHPVHSFPLPYTPSPSLSTLSLPLYILPSLSSQRKGALPWISSFHGISSCYRTRDTSPIELRQGSLVREKGSKGMQWSQIHPLLFAQLLRVPHEDQAAHLLHTCRKPTSIIRTLLSCWISLCELLWAQVHCFL